MSATSAIEWTDTTWNPVRGCSIVSPGCVNCYAMKQAHRFAWKRATLPPAAGGNGTQVSGAARVPGPYHGLTKLTSAGPQWTGVVRTVDDALLEPLSWRKPRRVFVNSMSDLFHEDVRDEFIDQVFNVMAYSPQHTFQMLTKRPERMRAYLSGPHRPDDVFDALYNSGIAERLGRNADDAICRGMDRVATDAAGAFKFDWPLPNVWLGVSAEDQQRADERIPLLLETPAAIRFISAEPLLGPVDVAAYLDPLCECETRESLHSGDQHDESCPAGGGKLDWLIVGGESGPGARGCEIDWVRSIVAQCRAAGVACFVKQLGAWPRTNQPGVVQDFSPFRDRKGGDPSEWPEDLRVREWPEVLR